MILLWAELITNTALLTAAVAIVAVVAVVLARLGHEIIRGDGASNMTFGDAVVLWFLIAVLWWTLASEFNLHRAVLLIAGAMAAGVLGIFVGFLTTAFDSENTSPIGKTRDWLFGGLAGLTAGAVLTGSAHARAVIEQFVEDGLNPGVQIGNMALFAMLGFFAMFALREFIWNLRLARSRRDLKRLLESQASSTPPPPGPPGPPAPSGPTGPQDPAAPSPPAAAFALQTPAARITQAETGRPPATPPPTPEARADALRVLRQLDEASIPASELSPRERLGLAVAYLNTNQPAEAAGVLDELLERGEMTDQALRLFSDAAERYSDPALRLHERAANWLIRYPGLTTFADSEPLIAYHLLWAPARLRESVTRNLAYLERHPESAPTHFNAACALAQLYQQHASEPDALAALDHLARAVSLNRYWAQRALSLTAQPDDDFFALARDKAHARRFAEIVASA